MRGKCCQPADTCQSKSPLVSAADPLLHTLVNTRFVYPELIRLVGRPSDVLFHPVVPTEVGPPASLPIWTDKWFNTNRRRGAELLLERCGIKLRGSF